MTCLLAYLLLKTTIRQNTCNAAAMLQQAWFPLEHPHVWPCTARILCFGMQHTTVWWSCPKKKPPTYWLPSSLIASLCCRNVFGIANVWNKLILLVLVTNFDLLNAVEPSGLSALDVLLKARNHHRETKQIWNLAITSHSLLFDYESVPNAKHQKKFPEAWRVTDRDF